MEQHRTDLGMKKGDRGRRDFNTKENKFSRKDNDVANRANDKLDDVQKYNSKICIRHG